MRTSWFMLCCNNARLASGWPPRLLLPALVALQLAGPASPRAAPVGHTSLRAAAEAAAVEQSLVLIVFGADWCAPCKELKKKTLESSEFQAQAGELHLAEVDIDFEAELARAYAVTAVPTLVLVTPDNKIVARRTGFVHTAELLLWLKDARERAKQGQWEGSTPGNRLDEFRARAAADKLDTNDLARLIDISGEADPGDRAGAAKLVVAQGELAMPALLAGVTNQYLGVRIAVAEMLRQLAPEAAGFDPWRSPSDLAENAGSLRKWWASAPRLSTPKDQREPDAGAAGSIQAAIDALRGNDPARRTQAMSALVDQGAAALGAVREAIRSCERAGDQRSLILLEDVRWTILAPEPLERKTGLIRNVLARGQGAERQAAAGRLARVGRDALPALAELTSDADPLVVESALRGLSRIGGKEALPPMMALLKSPDNNLRMTAAQALGHTKNSGAIAALASAFDDPDEVVACAAMSAVEEVGSSSAYSSNKRSQPPEVIAAFEGALADPRWRVRALAAEIVGKLRAPEFVPKLSHLLEDPDGFVVKSALGALKQLSATPQTDKIIALAQRHAGLKGEAVEWLFKMRDPAAAKAVNDMYNSAGVDGRLAILTSLGQEREDPAASTPWEALLERAIKETEPRLRLAAVGALAGQPPAVAAGLIAPLLADQDADTRTAAAGVLLGLLSGEPARVSGAHARAAFDSFALMEDFGTGFSPSRSGARATNQPVVSPERLAAWHAALKQNAGAAPEPILAAAIYVTGHSNSELLTLQSALERADHSTLGRFAMSAAPGAVLPRLPWPDGRAVLTRFCAAPALFLHSLAYTQKMPAGMTEFLFDPARFRAAVDPATNDDLQNGLPRLLEGSAGHWSLLASDPATRRIVQSLSDATNSAWRAAAAFALSQQETNLAAFERAVQDSNAWVRGAAVAGFTRPDRKRPLLEQRLGPLLADADKKVVQAAALGLLEAETRTAAGWEYGVNQFHYENIQTWTESGNRGGQRPLATLDSKPDFLQQARQGLTGNDVALTAVLAVLLAQYGDFGGMDRLLELAGEPDAQSDLGPPLFTAIALSRDPKYVVHLKKAVLLAKDQGTLLRLLQAIKGMSGPEARELRLEINRRIREETQFQ